MLRHSKFNSINPTLNSPQNFGEVRLKCQQNNCPFPMRDPFAIASMDLFLTNFMINGI